MKKLLVVAMLLFNGVAWGETVELGHPGYPAERTCYGCKVVIKEGYVIRVIHPKEGDWKLRAGDSVYVENFWKGRSHMYVDPSLDSEQFQALSPYEKCHLKAYMPTTTPYEVTQCFAEASKVEKGAE